MAIEIVGTTTQYGDGHVKQYDFSHTTTPDTQAILLFFAGMRFQSGSVPFEIQSATFDGAALTRAEWLQNYTTNHNYTSEIWYIANPASDTTASLSITTTSTIQRARFVSVNLTNVDTANLIGTTATDDTLDANDYLSAAIAIDAGDAIFASGVIRGDSGNGWIAGAGNVELDDYQS